MGDETSQERRLSAIMFTDMVGYSELTQENEKLAVELLEEHRVILRSIFEKYQGQEIEIVGDAFFIEFTSALDAVQCAIAIQKELYGRYQRTTKDRWIRVRIGVHVGDVIHKDKQVIGDCVNIAARMEPLAQPGGICLSEDVARQIYNKIELPLKSLGKGELKNIRLPVKIYKVVLPWEKASISHLLSNSIIKRKKNLSVIVTVVILIILIVIFSNQLLNNSFNNSGIITEKWSTNRLAVLPFNNYSPNADDEYISDGFTEEIITVLSKIENLQVIARTSVMKFKNRMTDINEVAQDLNVGIVLEGSVRKEKDRIRVTAQLIEAHSQEHLWAETYDEKYDHIFDLQDDIAYKVARALEITLKEMEKSQIGKKSTENIEAYDLYLKGRYYWNTRLPGNLMLGMECFFKAIDMDPGFALSYAGIADSYHLLASYGLLEPKIGFPRAKDAAVKAIDIDDNLAEGYNSLAAINLLFDWNWDEAEKVFIKALNLNSNYVQTYSWYALNLSINKRFDEAISLLNKAIALDPLSAITRTDLGQVYYHHGDYNRAVEEYQKSLNLDSTYAYTYAYLGQTYAIQGQLNKAEKAFSYAIELTEGKDPATLAGLAYVFARKNDTSKATAIISQLNNIGNDLYIHPTYLAIIYLALGNREEALAWLERGYQEQSEWMIFLQVEHMLDPLRSEEGFVELVKKMNFD
jgi:TolB-like protein/class 3 adenylate cyclase/cytochrome c-type biogenesis protein CcmH/NrfG